MESEIGSCPYVLAALAAKPRSIGNRHPLSAYGSRHTAPRCSTGASEANSIFVGSGDWPQRPLSDRASIVYRFPGHE